MQRLSVEDIIQKIKNEEIFDFVKMENDTKANAAIEAINGSDSGGRNLKVNEARPRPKSKR